MSPPLIHSFSSIFKKSIDNITNIKKNATNLFKINVLSKFNEAESVNLITEILAIDMSFFDKDKLYLELDNTFKKYYYQKRRAEILGRLGQDISSDEKQMLEIELGQILLKMAKLK